MLAAAVLLGFTVGSFLTVVVHRIAAGGTVVGGRSRCIHCREQLSWIELLPVLSFVVQGGRCRSCRGRIPWSYPLIEGSSAILFGALAWGLGAGLIPPPPFATHPDAASGGALTVLTFLYYAYFAASAIAISFYDAQHHRIPYPLIAPLVAVGLGALLIGSALHRDPVALAWQLLAALAAFGTLWGIWFLTKGRAMGRGDADVAFAIALYLGPRLTVIAFPVAFWLGAAYGILLLSIGRLHWQSALPLAPFLFLGAFVALFGSGWVPQEYFSIR